MANTQKQARALGILAGLKGEQRVWCHADAGNVRLWAAWRSGFDDAIKARVEDLTRATLLKLRIVPAAADDPLARVGAKVLLDEKSAEAATIRAHWLAH